MASTILEPTLQGDIISIEYLKGWLRLGWFREFIKNGLCLTVELIKLISAALLM